MHWVIAAGVSIWVLLRLEQIYRKLVKVMSNLDRITVEVSEMETVIDSAVKAITGLAQEVRDAGTDREKLNALADRMDTKAKALAEAIAANTTAADEPPAEPTPEPTPEG